MTTTNSRRAWGTGRIFKRKRSSGWYIRWYDLNGTRRTKATHTTSKSEAERMLRVELEAKSRGDNPDARKLRFDDLVKLFLDDRAVRGRRSRPKLKHLRLSFAKARALSITGAAVTKYERERLDAGAARATVNNELAALRRMFTLAVEKRQLLRDHAPVIHTPDPRNARQGFFEPEDFESIVSELPDYLEPVMRFGYFTGWRVRSEVLPL